MAIPADTVWEVNTTGSDTAAGGGFSIAQKGATGTDLTYPTPTITTFTSNLSAVGTTTLTCSAAIFLNTMLGNVIQISGQGFYCIQGFTSTTVVTVDRSLGTFATTSGWVGGALASPGQVAAIAVSQNAVWQKSGSYSITSASTNVAGGCVSSTVIVNWEGYATTRGDDGASPVLLASGISSASIFTSTGSSNIRNLTADGASLTSILGFNLGGSSVIDLCTAKNCTNSGFSMSRGSRCVATACAGANGAFNLSGGTVFLCEAYANTTFGFKLNSSAWAIDCLSYGNTGSSSDGFQMSSVGSAAIGCVAYANGGHGFSFVHAASTVGGSAINCIAEGQATAGKFGFAPSSGTDWAQLLKCAGYSNNAGNVSGNLVGINSGFVAGSSSFFVNAASSNFALNNTASAGASLRAAGIPGVYPHGLTTGYQDIGAAQHADPVKLLTLAGMTGGME